MPIQHVPLATLKKIIRDKSPRGEFIAIEEEPSKKVNYYAVRNLRGQAKCAKFKTLEKAEGWLLDDYRRDD